MFCSSCGGKCSENATFCGNCGAKIGSVATVQKPKAPVHIEEREDVGLPADQPRKKSPKKKKGKKLLVGLLVCVLVLAITASVMLFGFDFNPFRPSQFIVAFHLNDGTDLIHDEISVVAGNPAEAPMLPVREGYTFRYWTRDRVGNYRHNFSAIVNEHLALYAQWEEIVVGRTVTLNLNFEGAENMPPLVVEEGSTIAELPIPERSGYNFVNWARDPEGQEVVSPDTSIMEDDDFYAQWEPDSPATLSAYAAFYDVLRSYVDRYGIVDEHVMVGGSALEAGVHYANLVDFDLDGIPELVVTIPSDVFFSEWDGGYVAGYVEIRVYGYIGGRAEQLFSGTMAHGNFLIEHFYAVDAGGKTFFVERRSGASVSQVYYTVENGRGVQANPPATFEMTPYVFWGREGAPTVRATLAILRGE